MGYTVAAEGKLTVPVDIDLSAAISAARRMFASVDDRHWGIADFLRSVLRFDVFSADPDGNGNMDIEFVYYSNWSEEHLDVLSALAASGATGHVECTGEDQDRWMVELRNGRTSSLTAKTYYPGAHAADAEVVALTRGEVAALLALIAGESTDAISDLVSKVTLALGSPAL